MNKTQLFEFLEQIGSAPKKSLSQNFLIDPNIVDKIVTLADVNAGDLVLEIGPGPGAITEALLHSGARVFAVEKDNLFADHLPRLDGDLHVHHGDFLDFPLSRLQKGPWKVVSALPYHLTTPILEKLCKNSSLFTSFTLIMQKEAAERLQAPPKTKSYGFSTILLQFYTTVIKSFSIPPHCFYPAPAVTSTAIRFDIQEPPSIDKDRFFFLVQTAFQQRRKMISSSLREFMPDAACRLETLCLSPKARPEDLSLEEWVQLLFD